MADNVAPAGDGPAKPPPSTKDDRPDLPEDFDPADHPAAEVVEALADATDKERDAIAGAELQGKARKSVLKAAGVDEGERMDSSGRRLLPWESSPK